MDRSTWKNTEREWSRWLGGERVPVTGRQRGDVPDIRHPNFSVEVKAGNVLSVRLQQGMKQAEAALKEGQMALLCVSHTQKGKRDRNHMVVMPLVDWLKLATMAGVQLGDHPVKVED